MDFVRGELVVCLAGREKGRLMCVHSFDGKYVYLSDGRERLLDNPKRKNPKHAVRTGKAVSEEDMSTNKALRKALLREV